jgi:hypothetical protein
MKWSTINVFKREKLNCKTEKIFSNKSLAKKELREKGEFSWEEHMFSRESLKKKILFVSNQVT